MPCGVRSSRSQPSGSQRPPSPRSRSSAARRSLRKLRGTNEAPSVELTARPTSGTSSGVHGKVFTSSSANGGKAARSRPLSLKRLMSRARIVVPPPQKAKHFSACCGVSHVCAKPPLSRPKSPSADQSARGFWMPASSPARTAATTRSSRSSMLSGSAGSASSLAANAAASAAPVIFAWTGAWRGRTAGERPTLTLSAATAKNCILDAKACPCSRGEV